MPDTSTIDLTLPDTDVMHTPDGKIWPPGTKYQKVTVYDDEWDPIRGIVVGQYPVKITHIFNDGEAVYHGDMSIKIIRKPKA